MTLEVYIYPLYPAFNHLKTTGKIIERKRKKKKRSVARNLKTMFVVCSSSNAHNIRIFSNSMSVCYRNKSNYRNNPKYWDRNTFVNIVDTDQTPQYAPSDQGLHCLPYTQQKTEISRGSRMDGPFHNYDK